MAPKVYSQVTEGIRVNVGTAYAKDESSPKHHYFVFAYRVEIVNESAFEVQLLTRRWDIVDGVGKSRIVEGDGVIGKQPVIAPGKRYSYISGSHFQTPIGKMSGHYIMERKIDGEQIQVQIPPFMMMVPYLNN